MTKGAVILLSVVLVGGPSDLRTTVFSNDSVIFMVCPASGIFAIDVQFPMTEKRFFLNFRI